MRSITKSKVEAILTTALRLSEPRFRLEKYDGRVSGSVISASFRGKRDHRRQEMIRNALESALGDNTYRLVGMILAYTPQEWDVDLPEIPHTRTAKAG